MKSAVKSCLIILSFAIFIYKDVGAQSWQWAARAGGSGGNSNDNPNEMVMDMRTDTQGNIYVCGRIGQNADFNGDTVTTYPTTLYNCFLAKLDCAGNTIWVKTAGGQRSTQAMALELDGNGSIFLTGQLGSIPSQPCTFMDTTISEIAQDLFLAKFDTAGDFKWIKVASPGTGSLNTRGRKMHIDANTNIHIIGQGGSNAGIIFPGFTYNPSWLFVVKFDTTGNVLNYQDIGTTNFVGKWNDFKIGNAGEMYFTGSFSSDSMVIGSQTLYKITNAPGGSDMYLAKYDSAGIFQWVRHFGDTISNFVSGNGIEIVGTDVILTGRIINSITIDGFSFNNNLNPNTGEDFPFIAKFNSGGIAIWATNTHSQFQSRSEAGITALANGSSWVGGYFGGNTDLGGSTYTSTGLRDIFIAQVSSFGVVQQGAVISGSGNGEAPQCITHDAYNNIFLGGGFDGTLTVNGVSYSNAGGISDGLLAKYGTQSNCTVGLEEFLATDNIKLVAWPNPVSDVLYVQLPATSSQTIQLFNSHGQKVFEKQYTSSGQEVCQINFQHLPEGLYLIVLSNKINMASAKIIKN